MSATNLSRRSMFGLLLGTAATAALGTYSKPAAAKAVGTNELMVIYVSAEDCGPCRVFEAEDLPRWMASPLARTVRLVRIRAPKTGQAFQAKYWPGEARPYMSAFRAPIVPSFMLVAGGNVVASGSGLNGWRQQTLPQVQQMARA
jgi:hypothetical protein